MACRASMVHLELSTTITYTAYNAIHWLPSSSPGGGAVGIGDQVRPCGDTSRKACAQGPPGIKLAQPLGQQCCGWVVGVQVGATAQHSSNRSCWAGSGTQGQAWEGGGSAGLEGWRRALRGLLVKRSRPAGWPGWGKSGRRCQVDVQIAGWQDCILHTTRRFRGDGEANIQGFCWPLVGRTPMLN
jgi:hypothetical protein